MGILKQIIIYFFLLCIISCDSHEKLILPKTQLKTDFRTDGYYYNKNQGGYSTYFFYKNGIVYTYGSGYKGTDLTELDNSLKELFRLYSNIKQARFDWGLYLIENNNIKLEKWVTTSASTYPTNFFEGNLLSNDKFIFKKKTGTNDYVKKNKSVTSISEDFNFRQFSPKPDSTNNFIK